MPESLVPKVQNKVLVKSPEAVVPLDIPKSVKQEKSVAVAAVKMFPVVPIVEVDNKVVFTTLLEAEEDPLQRLDQISDKNIQKISKMSQDHLDCSTNISVGLQKACD